MRRMIKSRKMGERRFIFGILLGCDVMRKDRCLDQTGRGGQK